MTQEFKQSYDEWVKYLEQLGYRKVVLCKDCKYHDECLQGTVIDDTYIQTEWCSLGKRETDND